jgi:hypothetical protein
MTNDYVTKPRARGYYRYMDFIRTRLAALAVGLLVALPAIAGAQFTGALDLTGGLGRFEAGSWLRESRIAPTLRWTSAGGFLHLDGEALEQRGVFKVRQFEVDGSMQSPTFGVFRASVWGQHRSDFGPFSTALPPSADDTSLALRAPPPAMNPITRNTNVGGAISAKYGGNGMWIGTSAGNTPSRLDFGLWRVFRSAVFSVRTQSQILRANGVSRLVPIDSLPNDTAAGGWNYTAWRTVNETQVLRRSTLESRVDWAAGRLAVSASVSGRVGVELAGADSVRAPRARVASSRVDAAVQMTPGVSVFAGIGTLPRTICSCVSRTQYASFGIRLAPNALMRPPLPPAVRPAATAIVVRAVTPGTYKVTLRVPNARTVELSGDFNQWTPVSLREVKPNIWETTVPMHRGLHRVNVRIDGDVWTAPPGLPATEDEFNGRVGILFVR